MGVGKLLAAVAGDAGRYYPTAKPAFWFSGGIAVKAVGADGVYYRLTGLLAGQPDVSVIAAGCDGACFAATQVIVESAAGERFFDHVSSDAGLSRIALP